MTHILIVVIFFVVAFILALLLKKAYNIYKSFSKRLDLNHSLSRDLAYITAKGKEVQKSSKFINRRIGFIGDSLIHGFDDENNGRKLPITWPELLDITLHPIYTYIGGHSSASVMNVDGTPWAWSTEADSLPDEIDILGVMCGINDAFRYEVNGDGRYLLGRFGDKTPQTFYGSLWILYSELQEKYIRKGKKVFMLIYPYTDEFENWDKWVKAMYDTAECFHIKVCDLGKGLRLQPKDDWMYEYWRKFPVKGEIKHSPHVTQKGTYLFADYISEWMISNIE